jgi:uncharacterized membrane protein YjgN (DUF898 family)
MQDQAGTQPIPTPQFNWLETGGLAGLALINSAFNLITLGIYQFWAKTEVRKRIWSSIRLEGEPLSYTGTGRELFVGFLMIFAVVLIPILLVSVAIAFLPGVFGLIAQPLLYIAILFLFGVGVHRATRYRLTRTHWRGIRGGVEGDPWHYAWTYTWSAILIPFTFGWIIPWRTTRLQSILVNDIRFGASQFKFTENAGPLYGRFIALWLGGLVGVFVAIGGFAAIYGTQMMKSKANQIGQLSPTGVVLVFAFLVVLYLLAIFMSSWYRAGVFNVFAASTSFEGRSFKGTMTGAGLLWLTISNLVITLATFGVLAPLAQARSARYMIKHLSLDGPIAFDRITQSRRGASKQGEGLAQAFDFDAF